MNDTGIDGGPWVVVTTEGEAYGPFPTWRAIGEWLKADAIANADDETRQDMVDMTPEDHVSNAVDDGMSTYRLGAPDE